MFGSSQTHDEYLSFHTNSRKESEQNLKKAPKRQNNPRNFFMLPLLHDLGHQIGDRLGEKDYGFLPPCADSEHRKRDSNKAHGVDFEVPDAEQKDRSEPELNRNAVSVIMELMQQPPQRVQDKDFEFRQSRRFVCEFFLDCRDGRGLQLVEGSYAEGRSKKQAKTNCAGNTLRVFKSREPYCSMFGSAIMCRELGLKSSKDTKPLTGFEIAPEVYFGQRKGAFMYEEAQMMQMVQLSLAEMAGYDAGGYDSVRLQPDTMRDRGIFNFRNGISMDNPGVDVLYLRKFTHDSQELQKFKRRRKVPGHCHEHLWPDGMYAKKFSNDAEKAMWDTIWSVYRKQQKQQAHNQQNFGAQNQQNQQRHQQRSFDQRSQRGSQQQQHRQQRQRGAFDQRSEVSAAHSASLPHFQQYQNQNQFQRQSAPPPRGAVHYQPPQSQQKKGECTHLLVYDFDGTVYADRFYQRVIHGLENKGGVNAVQSYMNELSMTEIVNRGFGGIDRVNALKQHFVQLRSLRPLGLHIALYPRYHSSWVLRKLMEAIGVRIEDWFDEVLCKEHPTMQRFDNGVSKDVVIQSLCQEMKVNTKDVVYVDDDPKAAIVGRGGVECCDVVILQERKGMTVSEMRMVASKMQQRVQGSQRPRAPVQKQQQMDGHSSHSNRSNSQRSQSQASGSVRGGAQSGQNVAMENCMSCDESCVQTQMKVHEGLFFCDNCYWAQQDPALAMQR